MSLQASSQASSSKLHNALNIKYEQAIIVETPEVARKYTVYCTISTDRSCNGRS